MTELYLVREEQVPVEELKPGAQLLLPGGRRVICERVDKYAEGFVVRWWRRAESGEPGHPAMLRNGDRDSDGNTGRYLGSLTIRQRGETVRVARG